MNTCRRRYGKRQHTRINNNIIMLTKIIAINKNNDNIRKKYINKK